MLGTVVNCIAIIVGSLVGLIFKKVLKEELTDSILKVVGVVVIVLGLAGAFEILLAPSDINYYIYVLVFLVLGTLIGEMAKLNKRLDEWGVKLENRFHLSSFSTGFINASLIFCIGAMAIFGSVQGAQGDPTTLFIKAGLDGITACVLTVTFGWGVMFSAISVFVFQGAITGVSFFAKDFLLFEEFNKVFILVGNILVFCIGWNFISKDKIKVANILPSLFLIVCYYLIIYYFI